MSDTSPANQDALRHNAPKPAARQRVPGELLFEFLIGHDRMRCELRDHGQHGVEAQFYRNEEFEYSRRFHQRDDPTRLPRDLAVLWAAEERRALERG